MKYRRISASQITMSPLMLPSYSNFSAKIHGGFVLNLMDQVAFACASKRFGPLLRERLGQQGRFSHPHRDGRMGYPQGFHQLRRGTGFPPFSQPSPLHAGPALHYLGDMFYKS